MLKIQGIILILRKDWQIIDMKKMWASSLDLMTANPKMKILLRVTQKFGLHGETRGNAVTVTGDCITDAVELTAAALSKAWTYSLARNNH